MGPQRDTSTKLSMLAKFRRFFSRNRAELSIFGANQDEYKNVLEDKLERGAEPENGGHNEAGDIFPKQTFWIKVKVAKSSVAQFLDEKKFPIKARADIKGNLNVNLTPQLFIHLPREGLFLAEISLDNFATNKHVLVDVTDRRMNIFISKSTIFEKEQRNSKCLPNKKSKGLSRKDSKKIFDENSLEAIGYIDLPMFINSDHVNFYLDDENVFHIEAEIKGALSRHLARIRSNSMDEQTCGWRPSGIKVGSGTTRGMFQPGALSLRKSKKKECVWQIGFI